jgi:hypothetical protein
VVIGSFFSKGLIKINWDLEIIKRNKQKKQNKTNKQNK